jgi:hypothetical protein
MRNFPSNASPEEIALDAGRIRPALPTLVLSCFICRPSYISDLGRASAGDRPARYRIEVAVSPRTPPSAHRMREHKELYEECVCENVCANQDPVALPRQKF